VYLSLHTWITFDTSVCVVQVGVALGFLIPPAVVKNHDKLDDIGQDLNTLCYGYAIGPTAVLVLLLLCESATKGLMMHHCRSRQAKNLLLVPALGHMNSPHLSIPFL
jgi:Na+/H+-translocating membrane pyrophosphatase